MKDECGWYGWIWIKMDENGQKWMSLDISGWTWVKVFKNGEKMDESGWTYGLILMKLDKDGWKWKKIYIWVAFRNCENPIDWIKIVVEVISCAVLPLAMFLLVASSRSACRRLWTTAVFSSFMKCNCNKCTTLIFYQGIFLQGGLITLVQWYTAVHWYIQTADEKPLKRMPTLYF